ncbi:hypothetical protein [Bowdeniella nasicola]|uniref:hypothetical protein n=1 Tax=Bowdeniella nasicola TaxID=208480 RepID=UPI00115FFB97|nr:hypothetical protein [Bowdeniella nasicola]
MWQEIDTRLVKQGGVAGPVSVPGDVVLSLGDSSAGLSDVVGLSSGDGWRVAFGWQGVVPVPVLEGSRARYGDVFAGVDLLIDASRDGFEQSFEVRDVESLLAAGEVVGDEVVLRVPMRLEGVQAREGGQGVIEFVDASGEVVSVLVAPEAWDSSADDRVGGVVSSVPVSMGFEVVGDGVIEVSLGVSYAWVVDESRVYPVVVDPTYAKLSVKAAFDTYVMSGTTADRSMREDVLVGAWDGRNAARGLMNFSSSAVRGVDVVSAQLHVFETWSYSCSARPVQVWRAGGVASSASRWTNQPPLVAKVGEVMLQ